MIVYDINVYKNVFTLDGMHDKPLKTNKQTNKNWIVE